ncbi:MAG TPA: AAA family ATPase [Candidatus Krumholzibacteria bacterium]|nr:AAA family ATPase [Candidatus Krumholzibacteria bacterium]
MLLLEAHIRGFGKLAQLQLRFARGVQIVVGDNESGKSTLQKFLLAMLFGLKREDRRRREYLPDYERCKPWNGGAYGGRLVYELASGASFEVQRNFERKDESVAVLDAVSGRDLTAEFPLDERKERPFMQRQIQLSRQLFEATTALGQLAGRPAAEGVGALRQRIQGLLDSGDENLSAQAALQLLSQLEERLGSERTPTRGIGLLLRQRRTLLDERESAARRQAEILDLHARREVAAQTYAAHARAWEERRRRELDGERDLLQRRIQRFEKLDGEFHALQQQLSGYDDVADVDLADDAPARERASAIAALKAQADEREAVRRTRLVRAEELESCASALAGALGGMDPERLQKLQQDAARAWEFVGRVREARARQADEQRRNRALVDQLRRHHGRDWTRDEFLGELSSQRGLAHGETAQGLNTSATQAWRDARRRRGVLAILALGATAAVAGCVFLARQNPAGWSPLLSWGGVAAVSAVAAWTLLVAVGGWVAARDLARSLQARAEQAALGQSAAAEWLTAVLQRNHVEDVEALERARRDYETLRAQAERISSTGGREIQHLEAQLEALGSTMHALMRDCDLDAVHALAARATGAAREALPYAEEEQAEGTGADDLADLRRLITDLQLLPQLRRAVAWLERVRAEHTSLQQHDERENRALEELHARLEGERAGLAAILRRNGASDLADFAERIRRARERERLFATRLPMQREQDGVLAGEHVTALRERLSQLDPAPPVPAVETVVAVAWPGQSLEELSRAKDGLAAERAQIDERLAAREQEGRLPAEIELELQEVEMQIEGARRGAAAMRLAMETLQEVATTLHREVAPRMNARVGQLFAQLTRSAHGDVLLSEDLTPRVRMDGDALCGVESLSGGAADQLYFAVRLTAGEVLARRGEHLPLLLDDPFVQYDPERLQAALDLVTELAREHQVLFLTCEEVQAEALSTRLRKHGILHDILRL